MAEMRLIKTLAMIMLITIRRMIRRTIIANWILPTLAKQEDSESSNTPHRTNRRKQYYCSIFYGDQSSRALENVEQNKQIRNSEDIETFFSFEFCKISASLAVFARFFFGLMFA